MAAENAIPKPAPLLYTADTVALPGDFESRNVARLADRRRTRMLNNRIVPLFMFLLAGGPMLASPAYADANAATPQESGELEEVVVTAQKRQENIQDVPLAVSQASAIALTEAGISTAFELPNLVSGLNMGEGGGVVNVFMRGVGNPAQTIGNEASVAMFIDGVYYARLAPAALDLNNISGIEVLKGPQGTLFGRNADAGVIQISTREPTQSPTFHIDVGYGNYDTYTENLYASTGFGEKVAGDIAVHAVNQNDGWGHYVITGAPYGLNKDLAVRSKWVFQASDATKVTLIGDYMRGNNSQSVVGTEFRGTTSGTPIMNPPYTVPLVANPKIGFYDSVSGPGTYNLATDKSYGGALKVEQDFSVANLTSISAYRRGYGAYDSGADFSTAGAFEYLSNYADVQTTQEFQLASNKGGPLDWQMGLYYMKLESSFPFLVETGPYIASFIGAPIPLEVTFMDRSIVNSYSAYTQETFHFSPQDDITAGLRYTDDRDSFGGQTTLRNIAYAVAIPTPSVASTAVFPKVTYRLSLDHHFNDDLMAYASYSRGFKSGTYNLLPPTPKPADSEVLDTYELGAKTDFFDHRLRVNPAIFYNKIASPQVQEIVVSQINLVNAGSAKTYGMDLDGEALLTDRLRAHFSASVLKAYYSEYNNAPIAYTLSPSEFPGYGTSADYTFNAAGKSLPFAPRYTCNLGLVYQLPTPIGDWTLSGDWSYSTGYVFDPDNIVSQRPFSLLNARARYVFSGNDHWSIAIWGKNLAGTEYYSGENEFAGTQGHPAAPGAPRTFGFTLAYDIAAR